MAAACWIAGAVQDSDRLARNGPPTTRGIKGRRRLPDIQDETGRTLVAQRLLLLAPMGLFYRNQPFIFGETTYVNGGSFGPVHGGSVNLVIVVEGSMVVSWDGLSAEIPTGRVALIYSCDSIEFQFPLGTRTVVQWCDTGEPAGSGWVRQKLKKAPLSLDVFETLRQLMDIGLKLSCENRDEVRAFRDALGEAMICAYLHQANLDWDEALVPEPVTRGKDFIERHFCEYIDNAQIARCAGVSPQYLDRLFKRSHGVSPVQHLWNLRAEKGAFLLRQTGLTVGEIAYQCGYKTPFHFSRQIKVKYGHSPSDLRKLKTALQPSLLRGEYPDQHFDGP
jgi:AraC family L-rhamnose operon regulatory protein RhaS